jgi:hypothetical protein
MERPPAASIAQTCAALRSQGYSAALSDINAWLTGSIGTIKTSETGFTGVLAEDGSACNAATLQKFSHR